MKYTPGILILLLLISCGNRNTDIVTGSIQLEFSLDTVLIDPGDEFLFLNAGLRQSTMSKDLRFLYNFNPNDHSVEQIDLDELKLVQKFPFEKEGPDGTGDFFHSFFLVGEDSLLISSYPNTAIFNFKGKKIQNLEFQKVGEKGNRLKEGEFFLPQAEVPGQNQQFLGYIRNWEEKKFQIMKMDLIANLAYRMDLPAFDKMMDFQVEFSDGRSMMIMGPETYLVKAGEKILLGNNVANEWYWYLSENDSLLLKTYESQLTENQKSGKHPSQVDNQEAFQRIFTETRGEINFGKPFWDCEKKVYYRFSYKEAFDDAEDSPFPSATSAEVFLTVFNPDLEMMAESLVPHLEKTPAMHFVKDGKIWIFENIEDEMGFVRLDIKGFDHI